MKTKTKLLMGIGAAAVVGILAVLLRLVGREHSGEEVVYREDRV